MSSSDQPSERCRCMCTAGSRSPERVPITRPSSGVSPIEVSTDSPTAYGGGGRAVAEVQHDQVGVLDAPAERTRGLAGDERVRGAVEPVAADVVLVAPRARDGVGVRDRRHRLVEGRVEDHDLRQVGEQLAGHRDALEVGRVVQRRQRHQRRPPPRPRRRRPASARRSARRRARPGARPRPPRCRSATARSPRRRRRGAQRVLERRERPLLGVLRRRRPRATAVRSPRRSARPTPARAPRRSRRRPGCTSATTSRR